MNRARFLCLALAAPWSLRQLCAGELARDPRAAAIQFLLTSQSADGAWRADTYGAFRSGHALTPVVLRALSHFTDVPSVVDACVRGADWLVAQQKTWLETYPVHLAAAMLETLPRLPALQPLRQQAVDHLIRL